VFRPAGLVSGFYTSLSSFELIFDVAPGCLVQVFVFLRSLFFSSILNTALVSGLLASLSPGYSPVFLETALASGLLASL